MVSTAMSDVATQLPNDPAVLKAMIAALQAENQKMSASLRAHDLLVQALRVRIEVVLVFRPVFRRAKL